METRANPKSKSGSSSSFSEAELDHLRNQAVAKEAQLREQTEALNQQRDSFQTEQETFAREREEFLRERAAFKNARANFEIDKQNYEQGIRDAKIETKGSDAESDEPPLLVQDRSMETSRIYDTNRDRDSELETLRREVAALKSSISCRANRPARLNDSGQTEILIDDGYETPAPVIAPPRLTTREALDLVPVYNGQNMTLLHFLRACRRGRDRLPANHERQFAQAIYSKLRGLAADAVDEDQCNSIDQIEEQLNYTFGSLETADECRAALRNLVQKRGENVVTYIARVRDMRYTLLELEQREKGALHQGELRKIESIVATAFCHGLPPEVRNGIPLSGYADFSVAAAHAQATTRLNERYADRRNREERDRYVPRSEPLAHSTPMRSLPPPRRSVQWRERASPDRQRREEPRYYDRPQQRHEAPRRRPDDGPPPRRPSTSDKFCRYCKNRGHEIEECRKRQYNNSARDQGNGYRPSRPLDAPRAGRALEPIRPIQVTEAEALAEPASPPSI